MVMRFDDEDAKEKRWCSKGCENVGGETEEWDEKNRRIRFEGVGRERKNVGTSDEDGEESEE